MSGPGIFYRISAPQAGKDEIVQCSLGVMTPREAMLHAINFLVADGDEVGVGDEIEVYGPYTLPEPKAVFVVTAKDLRDSDDL